MNKIYMKIIYNRENISFIMNYPIENKLYPPDMLFYSENDNMFSIVSRDKLYLSLHSNILYLPSTITDIKDTYIYFDIRIQNNLLHHEKIYNYMPYILNKLYKTIETYNNSLNNVDLKNNNMISIIEPSIKKFILMEKEITSDSGYLYQIFTTDRRDHNSLNNDIWEFYRICLE